MGFALGGSLPEQVRGGPPGPDDGESDKRHQEGELARVGDAGILKVEASGLGVAEQAFDGPSLAVGGQRLSGRDVGDHDQPFAVETLGGEVQERRVAGLCIFAGADTGLEELGAPGEAEPGEEREITAVLGGDTQVLAQADREGNVVIVQEFKPLGTDELAIRQQEPDCRGRKMRVISAIRVPVPLLPGPSSKVQNRGTRKRRVTTASTR